jgi:hypothetical protein
MKYSTIFGLALATFVIATPIPDPEADAELTVTERLVRDVEHGVGLAPQAKYMIADEPIDLVTRQAAAGTYHPSLTTFHSTSSNCFH